MKWIRDRLAPVLAVPLLMALAGCAAHTMPEVHSETERLDLGNELMRKGRYLDATDLFKTYIQKNAGTAQVDGAICMLGECYLQTRDWTLAQEQFERLLKDYPESDSAGSAAFLLGDALMGQSRPKDFDQLFTQRAIDQWNDYLHRYPGHWRQTMADRRVLDARSQLAQKLVDTGNLYVKLREWQPARVYYRRTISDYRETVPSADAEIGLAVVDAKLGKTTEALAALQDIEDRFPGRPVAGRAAVERKKIEFRRAKARH
jgi:outer membrane assembly lipoprotein YfiO